MKRNARCYGSGKGWERKDILSYNENVKITDFDWQVCTSLLFTCWAGSVVRGTGRDTIYGVDYCG